jgi:hypothetical protein
VTHRGLLNRTLVVAQLSQADTRAAWLRAWAGACLRGAGVLVSAVSPGQTGRALGYRRVGVQSRREEFPMAAYIISYLEITDFETLDAYRKVAGPSLVTYGAKPLVIPQRQRAANSSVIRVEGAA